MTVGIKAIQDESYASETQTGVVVVDFRSDFCPGCTTMDHILTQLAQTEQFGSQVKFTSLTVNRQPQVARLIGVQSTPTMLIKKDGQIVDAVIGIRSLGEIRAKLARHLA